MPNDKHMKRYSATDLRARLARGKDRSDYRRVRSMTEAELEAAIASDPDSDPAVDWTQATITLPRNKQGVFLRLDPDILEYFRAQGAGYQTRINAVLRSYVTQMQAGDAAAKKRAG